MFKDSSLASNDDLETCIASAFLKKNITYHILLAQD